MAGTFANPASRSHQFGWQAEQRVEAARNQLADLLGCNARELVWTSGATESNNLALKGVFDKAGFEGHLLTSVVEHKAVLDPAEWLQEQGVKVGWLQPDSDGVITLRQVEDALQEDTRLVSLMLVNNETGVVTHELAEIGALCRQRNILLHVDAAQAIGKVAFRLDELAVDLMSFSAHKFYGPKGIGALYVRRAVQGQLNAAIHGGGHERGMRSGTLPTHQIVGMGEAASIVAREQAQEIERLAQLRDRLWQGVADLPGVSRNGSAAQVSPAHLNLCFSGVEGETLLLSLRELAVSSGSACTSASMAPSYVLKAMGLSDADAHSSLRFSVGRFSEDRDIDRAIDHIRQVYSQLQQAV